MKDKNKKKDWSKNLREVKRNKYTSIHEDPPIWSMGKDKRKGLFNLKARMIKRRVKNRLIDAMNNYLSVCSFSRTK